MTRDEFLNRLGELLACLPADQVKETQEFYAEVIADRMEDGMTEAEAVATMGTLGEVAEATLDELPAVPRAIARTKRKSTALLWALAIVGSPVWIPLLLAFVAVAATVYICIWVLALCVWIVAAAFGGAGVVGLLFTVDGIIIGHVPYVLTSMGMGFASIGVALLAGAGAWMASSRSRAFLPFGRRKPFRPSGKIEAIRAAGALKRRRLRHRKECKHVQRKKDLPCRSGWACCHGARPGCYRICGLRL